MPVFEDAAGHEPEVELVIGRLGGRLIGDRQDDGAAVLLPVELQPLSDRKSVV